MFIKLHFCYFLFYSQVTDLVSKDTDIVKVLVKIIAAICACEFTADHLTNRAFLCKPSSPQAVTYQTLLYGTPQVPIEEIITMLEEWANSGIIITVQFLSLKVEGFCAYFSPYAVKCDVTEPPPMGNWTVWSISDISGVVVMLVLLVLVVVIVIIFTAKIWRAMLKSNKM